MTNLLPPQILTLLSQSVTRRHLKRDREGSHQQIWKDYFAEKCTYPVDYFHRRYRMRRELFICILNDVEAHDEYFIQKKDYCGQLGCSSIQKMTAVVCILAYGFSADHCDEYLKMGKTTAIESLKHFCDVVIALYEGQYLRSPNEQDIAHLLQVGEERGFPDYARNPAILAAHISSRLSSIRNKGTNAALRLDLMEHLWTQFGDQIV
ncbi:hypothetical protein L1049_017323 [Liquidambar formosana]|uniref:Uncharacterized protein n=1 Tax=Liquidambar formosana TaxID=63359 RepID=A0AAP0S7A6_LIQFO